MLYFALCTSVELKCFFIAPCSTGFIDRDFFLELWRITQTDEVPESFVMKVAAEICLLACKIIRLLLKTKLKFIAG